MTDEAWERELGRMRRRQAAARWLIAVWAIVSLLVIVGAAGYGISYLRWLEIQKLNEWWGK